MRWALFEHVAGAWRFPWTWIWITSEIGLTSCFETDREARQRTSPSIRSSTGIATAPWVFTCAPIPPGLDGRFELDHDFYGDAHEHLARWFADPHYSLRPELVAWLDDPPNETGHGD